MDSMILKKLGCLIAGYPVCQLICRIQGRFCLIGMSDDRQTLSDRWMARFRDFKVPKLGVFLDSFLCLAKRNNPEFGITG